MPDDKATFVDFIAGKAQQGTAAALQGLAAIYEAGNKQAAKLPGTSKLASLGKRGSEELHAWAKAPASRDVQKSRETFAKLFDFVVPQDELGMLLSATPVGRPARQTRSARNYRYFHGTTPERAEAILAGEGFQSGRSALLGVEGTSLSRDPNVSLHRFAEGDPMGLLAVDVPERLQQQMHHMSPEDFYGTKELLESPNAPLLYNKPSTIYKELETFVRRVTPEEPGGQLGLFRPTDEMRARRLTPEELRFATTVEGHVQNAFRQQADVNERSWATFGERHKIDASREDMPMPDDYGTLAHRGLPTPRDVISTFRNYVGAGSNTERAKAGMFLGKMLRETNLYMYGSTKNPKMGMTPRFLYPDPRTPYSDDFSIDIVGGKPIPKYIGRDKHPPTNYEDFKTRLSQWWSSRSKNTKDAFRQWDTPQGKKLLHAHVTENAHMLMGRAKDNIQSAIATRRHLVAIAARREAELPGALRRGEQLPVISDEIELEMQKLNNKREPRMGKILLPGHAALRFDANSMWFRDLSESDFKSLVRVSDDKVSVNADELQAVLLRKGHEQMKAGVRAREKFIETISEMAH